MAFLRKQTSEGSIGLLYSIIQKCLRRGLVEESLYYSKVLYNEGTPNSLRKRLVYVTNEDICHIKLSNEILNCLDEDLFKYVAVCCKLKKTHDSAWLSRLSLHYAMNNIVSTNKEMIEAIKLTEFVRKGDYKRIREYIGKINSKLYTFSGKNNLVWASYIMCNNRPELEQEYIIENVDMGIMRKFPEVPFWVMDKHVSGGVKGYQFFFDNSLVVNENIYGDSGDKYSSECKKVYLDDEKNLGNGKTKVLYKLWKEQNKNPQLDIHKKDIYEKYLPGFKDVVQIQLITGKNKPSVYFATSEKDNKKYVLKGPITKKMRKQIKTSEKYKKLLKLNHLNVEFINIFDQNWMKSDSLLNYDFSKKELRISKLETNVYIYNGINSNYNFDNITKTNFIDIFINYIFRLVIGANDHCSRNFIRSCEKVYSIDDHSIDIETVINRIDKIKMKKKNKLIWDENIIINKAQIIKTITEWIDKLKIDKLKIDKLKIDKLKIDKLKIDKLIINRIYQIIEIINKL